MTPPTGLCSISWRRCRQRDCWPPADRTAPPPICLGATRIDRKTKWQPQRWPPENLVTFQPKQTEWANSVFAHSVSWETQVGDDDPGALPLITISSECPRARHSTLTCSIDEIPADKAVTLFLKSCDSLFPPLINLKLWFAWDCCGGQVVPSFTPPAHFKRA